MSTWLRVSLAALVSLSLLAGCASRSPEEEAKAKAAAPLVGDTEEQQKQKALDTRIAAGIEALKAGDPERARRHIHRALEIDEDSAAAQNAMALYYRYEGDDKREEQHYRKALRADSKYSQARNNYASLLYRQGRYDEAIDQLEAAAEDPTYDQRQMVFLNLGRSYARAGEYDKAVKALQRSLRLDSTQPEAKLEMADVLYAQGKYAEARNYYVAYTGQVRQNARSLWLGIRIEHELGGTEKVGGYEMQLGNMFPNSPEYKAWKAWKTGGSQPAPAAGKSKKGAGE